MPKLSSLFFVSEKIRGFCLSASQPAGSFIDRPISATSTVAWLFADLQPNIKNGARIMTSHFIALDNLTIAPFRIISFSGGGLKVDEPIPQELFGRVNCRNGALR